MRERRKGKGGVGSFVLLFVAFYVLGVLELSLSPLANSFSSVFRFFGFVGGRGGDGRRRGGALGSCILISLS